MAVAFDIQSESHTGTTGSASEASFTWSHNPTGVPRGVLVFTFVNANADNATGVTYDSVALTALAGARAVNTGTEPGDVKAWFLGASVPTTDPANVVVTRTNNANVMYAVAITLTGAANLEMKGTPVLVTTIGTLAETNVDSGADTAIRFAGLNSGLAAVPTIGGNSSAHNPTGSIDFGSRIISTCRETTPGSGSRPVGWSDAGSDDRAVVYLAIGEVAVAMSLLPTRTPYENLRTR